VDAFADEICEALFIVCIGTAFGRQDLTASIVARKLSSLGTDNPKSKVLAELDDIGHGRNTASAFVDRLRLLCLAEDQNPSRPLTRLLAMRNDQTAEAVLSAMMDKGHIHRLRPGLLRND